MRVPREFQIWKTHISDEELVGAKFRRRDKPSDSYGGDKIVLFNAVTADAKPTDKPAILVQR